MDKNNHTASEPSPQKSGAFWVAAGILLSRLSGLIRERIFAHYFGNSDAGDAFKAALRIPNFLQNLLGEGVLSASLIPVYAKLRAEKKFDEADQVARIVGSLLFLLTSLLCAGGMLLSPFLIAVIAPGFTGEKAELTTRLVQIFFPGIGLLVMSAWCLGVLNSHKKFFLSYVAPVIWNLAIIVSLVRWGSHSNQYDLAKIAAWGLVAGSFLQLLVQVPTTLKLLLKYKFEVSLKNHAVKSVLKSFFPVLLSRGVVQISAYIDSMLASLLTTGAVSALSYAQTLYLLPVSLFGMSVSAAELPAMSEARGSDSEIASYLSKRLKSGLEQISFFVIPTCIAFWGLGNLIVAALFQGGRFNNNDTSFVWLVLSFATIGLHAGTQARLYSSTFYSMKDTQTPLRFAFIRVICSVVLGYFLSQKMPSLLGYNLSFGTAGLAASSGLCAWIEFILLRRALEKRFKNENNNLKNSRLDFTLALKITSSALIALFISFFLNKYFLTQSSFLSHPILTAVIVMSAYALSYLACGKLFRIAQAERILKIVKI